MGAAGIRQAPVAFAGELPDLRVLDGRLMVIEQAMGIPKPRAVGATYLACFLNERKRNGFIAAALERSGQMATIAF